MSITTDGMEVVAWFVTTENQDGTKQSYPLSGRYKDVVDACDFGEPVALVTLASAQAAVAAAIQHEEDVHEAWQQQDLKEEDKLLKRITELEAALTASLAQPEPKAPTVPDNMQDWRGMDGAIAWHLIERHADNWADIGKMMDEWLAANQSAPQAQSLDELRYEYLLTCDFLAAEKYLPNLDSIAHKDRLRIKHDNARAVLAASKEPQKLSKQSWGVE